MGSTLPLVAGLIWAYVVWRFVWLLPGSIAVKLMLAALFFLVAQYHQITGRYFGTLASPELPQWILIGLAWAFGLVLMLALLLLLRDVIGLLIWLPARAAGRAILGGQRLSVALGILALVLTTFGVWQAVRVPLVKTVSLSIAGLPPALDGYRLVQLTDLHASRLLPRDWQAGVVAKTNALGADLIVITGDLADGTPEARAPDVQPLQGLRAPDGVLMIPGNHEYYADYVRWMQAYRALGLTVLENSHVLIEHHGATLAVAGLTDRQARSFGLPRPDLAAALKGIPDHTPVILLEHRPETARNNAQAPDIILQLSGHTHGGQILGPHLLTQWANKGFVSGLYTVGRMLLYVSNGTGLWNGLALRVGRPSEITEIVLHAR